MATSRALHLLLSAATVLSLGAAVYRPPLDDVELPISSSEIRARLARGESPPEVPPAVLDYIQRHALYGAAVSP